MIVLFFVSRQQPSTLDIPSLIFVVVPQNIMLNLNGRIIQL